MSPLLALLAAIAFVVPATAAARKNAWQLSALSGTYEYTRRTPRHRHAARVRARFC